MGVGPKPKDDEPHAKPEIIEDEGGEPDQGVTNGGEGVQPVEVTCWTFPLDRATDAAAEVVVGDDVLGACEAGEVMVYGPTNGVLGFAPHGIAADILDACRLRRAPRLEGEVTGIDDLPNIRLCLVEAA